MKHNKTQLSDHFTFRRLLRFTFPSVVMLVFNSIYGVVDGFFVSNFAGKEPFTAVNFIMPLLMLLGGAGFLFGTGGGALIVQAMGAGNSKKANETFSLVVYAAAACGIVLAGAGLLFLRPVAARMGAEGALLENCILYGTITCIALPFFILQYEFQCLFAVTEKPKLGLFVTAAVGCMNMALDALFVAGFGWGISGAAVATALSQAAGAVIPLVYFFRPNSSRLRLGKCRADWKSLLRTVTNGSSELVNSVSASVVGMLYNIQLMKYAGEDGVASYGVLMYVSLVFNAIFIGYSVGSAPVASYHYGAQNSAELKSLRKKSLSVIALCSLFMFAAGELLARPLSHVFVGYDPARLELTVHAFSVFSFAFLLSGFSIYGSSFFTALGDGLTSALISFLRTLVFQCTAVLFLPVAWGANGIWASVVAAELASALTTILFLLAKKRRYGY